MFEVISGYQSACSTNLKVTLTMYVAEINQNRVAVKTTENEALKTSPVQQAAGAEAAVGGAPAGRGWYYNADDERYSLCDSETRYVSNPNKLQ